MDVLPGMKRGIFEWLDRISEQETLPDDIAAVWIGLFEAAAPTAGWAVYLTGSRIFDEDDPDWPCYQDFEPKSKYMICTDATVNAMEWDAFLEAMVGIIQEYLAERPQSLLGQARHVGVGFDAGDVNVLK